MKEWPLEKLSVVYGVGVSHIGKVHGGLSPMGVNPHWSTEISPHAEEEAVTEQKTQGMLN